MRGALEAQAQAAGLHELRWPGYVTQPREFLADLHLYLQPSRVEGFCIAAHEAMAAGLPVLACAVGEMPHSILSGKTGVLVPPRNSRALADALRDLLCRPDQLAAMGTAARERVLERFSLQRFSQRGHELFNRMAAAGEWRRGWDSNPRSP